MKTPSEVQKDFNATHAGLVHVVQANGRTYQIDLHHDERYRSFYSIYCNGLVRSTHPTETHAKTVLKLMIKNDETRTINRRSK